MGEHHSHWLGHGGIDSILKAIFAHLLDIYHCVDQREIIQN